MHTSKAHTSKAARTILQSFAALAALGFVACGKNDGGTRLGHYAQPTTFEAILNKCSGQALDQSFRFVKGKPLDVCRLNATGVVEPKTITPHLRLASRKGRILVDQKIGVRLSHSGLAPGAVLDDETTVRSEVATLQFLESRCAPAINAVFSRSRLLTRFSFHAFREWDRVAVAEQETVRAKPENDLFDENFDSKTSAGRQKVDPKKPDSKKTVKPDVTSEVMNFSSLLDLTLGADQGITISDEPTPLSSGPLRALDPMPNELSDEQKLILVEQNRFCGQLLIHLAQGVGVGGLAEGESCDAKDEAAVKSAGSKGLKGLVKSGDAKGTEVQTMKLDENEVLEIIRPTCGAIETATKEAEKNVKK